MFPIVHWSTPTHYRCLEHFVQWQEAKGTSFGSQSLIKKQPFLNTPELIEWITDLQNSIQFQFYWANFKTIISLMQTGKFPLHLLLLTVILNPKSSPIKKKTWNSSLRFSLETMKGTTGQKRRTKQTKNKTPALAQRAMAPTTSSSVTACLYFRVLILFNLNGVPRFGTINEERMKQFQFGI